MARTVNGFGSEIRIGDYVSVGVLAKVFPLPKVREVLRATGKESLRERELPAHIVIYYVIAMTMYMQVSYQEVLRCLLQGLQWLFGPRFKLSVPGKSSISQARTRLGYEPMRKLHDDVVKPIATQQTKGAWYHNWLVVAMDGSTLDIADTAENDREFGRPQAAEHVCAFPQLRFVSLLECGTRVLFGSELGGYRKSELVLAKEVIPFLKKGMLCLADRHYLGFELWGMATTSGADLLWRARSDILLPCRKRLPDGSYLSRLYGSFKDRKLDQNGITVRVIDYVLEGVPDAEPLYRLVTSILDHKSAPAEDLAALYHERWEVETALDELKTHLRGSNIVLRSKTPELVKQEFFGLMMSHFVIRGIMHEAALAADEDPDRLSYSHAVRVIRRKVPQFAAFPPERP